MCTTIQIHTQTRVFNQVVTTCNGYRPYARGNCDPTCIEDLALCTGLNWLEVSFWAHVNIIIHSFTHLVVFEVRFQISILCLRCFDTVGWASGRASSLSGVGVVICLEWGADCLHIVQLMLLHPKTPSYLASFKSRLVLLVWYQLTQVVREKRPLNGCRSSSILCLAFHIPWFTVEYTAVFLTNSSIQAANAFPFHRLYKTVCQSSIDRLVHRLGLQTNFQCVERMTDKSDANSTGSTRQRVFSRPP